MPTYKQPSSVPVLNVAGYPSTDIGMDDVMVKGKYMPGAKTKVYSQARGGKAAVKGKNFREATPKNSDK